MNRSADRLNLCLPGLKGAGQLKNFIVVTWNEFSFAQTRPDAWRVPFWKFQKCTVIMHCLGAFLLISDALKGIRILRFH